MAKQKLRFTKLSGGELGGAIVLGIAGLLILLSAWRGFRFYTAFSRGLLEYGSGLESARDSIVSALERDPDNVSARILLAKIETDGGTGVSLTAADNIYAGLVQSRPLASNIGRAVVQMRSFDADRNPQRLAAARTFLDAAVAAAGSGQIEQLPFAPGEPYIHLGHLLLRQGDTAGARAQFDYVAANCSTMVPGRDALMDLYIGLGVTANQEGNYVAAREQFRKAYQVNSSRVSALVNVAYMESRHYAGDRCSKADVSEDRLRALRDLRKELTRFWRVDPIRYKAVQWAVYSLDNSLGLASYRFRTLHEAKIRFESANEVGIRSAIMDLNRAEIYWNEACRTDTTPQAIMAAQGEARRYYNDAVQSDWEAIPDRREKRPRAKNNLAAVIYARGLVEWKTESLRLLREAVKEAPEDDRKWVLHRNLGVILHKLGGRNVEEALAEYEKSLALKPDQPKLKDAIDRLRRGD